MNKIKRAVPHLFTCGNLLCGCLAIVKAFEGNLIWSAYLVGIAAVLDFFDGFVARALGVSGDFGKQLDSLADCVTFGVVPGMVMFQLIGLASGRNQVSQIHDTYFVADPPNEYANYLPYIAFIIPVFSALRLAKFNIDTRQSDSFIGVPTPANSILICSLPLILGPSIPDPKFVFIEMVKNPGYQGQYPQLNEFILSNYFLIPATLVMSFLLVAELPLFALKFKDFKWRGNEIRFIFLAASVLMLVFLKFVGLPLIIVLYVLMSVINNFSGRKKNR